MTQYRLIIDVDVTDSSLLLSRANIVQQKSGLASSPLDCDCAILHFLLDHAISHRGAEITDYTDEILSGE